MSRCVTCGQFFAPNFCVVRDDKKNHLQCVFCYLKKNEVTLETDGKDVKVSKADAIKSYEIYTKKIVDKKMTKDLVNPKSNIIIP